MGGDMSTQFANYDDPICEYCGDTITGGVTRFTTGQICHHSCANEYHEQVFGGEKR